MIAEDLPDIAAEWLAPLQDDFEGLMPREGESDAEFIARVKDFATNIADLYDKMDRKSLEAAMYQANAEGLLIGISSRLSQGRAIAMKRRRKFKQRTAQ